MKKRVKKLLLFKETLANLQEHDLKKIAAGGGSQGTSCEFHDYTACEDGCRF